MIAASEDKKSKSAGARSTLDWIDIKEVLCTSQNMY